MVLVLYSGTYIFCMIFYYLLLNKRYSKTSDSGTVVHFDYRCAPEYRYPCALEDTVKVWNRLLKDGFLPENIIIVGDSAGGHLCVNLMMKQHDLHMAQPRTAVMMSPWLDMTALGRTYMGNYPVGRVFGIKGKTIRPEEVKELLMSSKLYMWLGGQRQSRPYISLIFAVIDDSYPPIFVSVDGHKMLLSDAQTLVEKWRKVGLRAELYVGEGMFHAFEIYQLFPEAKKGLKAVFAFIREIYAQ